MRKVSFSICIFIFSTLPLLVFADEATIYGKITDTFAQPIDRAMIQVEGTNIQSHSLANGTYRINVPAGEEISLAINHPSMETVRRTVEPLNANDSIELNVVLQRELHFDPVEIFERRDREIETIEKLDIESMRSIPTPSGNIESVLSSLPGVAATHELSSQYSVRGGSFDENLVYINGFEIFRPFLIRSGQQEGLSIINPDMVEELSFSAGGFDARYGDKMASVLDITYREPDEFRGIARASVLGGSLFIQGVSEDYRFRYMGGARYRTTRYLLGSLDVEGEYNPAFSDIQSYISYDLSPEWQVSLLTHYGHNEYQTIPETQETTFGTVQDVKRLTVFFQGQEIITYQSFMSGLSFKYEPSYREAYHFDASFYTTAEHERIDVIGNYWLDQVESDLGSEDFGEAIFNLGVGGYHHYARNRLAAQVGGVSHRGRYSFENSTLRWGTNLQMERIVDRLSEWQMLDSAGYSIPRSDGDELQLETLKSSVSDIQSGRISAYVQNQFNLSDSLRMQLTTGIRANYWTYSGQTLISPRLSFSFEPNRKYNLKSYEAHGNDSLFKNRLVYRFASGLYQQPPFYREFRDFEGNLNPDIQAQSSVHAILGQDIYFDINDRPFKFTTEVWYKYFWNQIPYEFDNTRTRYFAVNNTEAYATGIDFQLYGEFLFDLPSWASLSFLRSRERAVSDFDQGDDYVFTDEYVPRPTDQLVMFSFFFQDFLPMNPNYKVFLNMFFGSGLPHSPPGIAENRNSMRLPPYRRVDVGFSGLLYAEENHTDLPRYLRYFDNIWLRLDVFNLFDIRNTIDYFWVRDVSNNQYAVPNYLTSRRVNLTLEVAF